jgi:hypothetical protein
MQHSTTWLKIDGSEQYEARNIRNTKIQEIFSRNHILTMHLNY